MVQAELAEESKAEAVAQALKAAGKTTIPVPRGDADRGNTDQGAAKKEREQKLHRLTRKKRRRILAREADERQAKEEAEELKAQGVGAIFWLWFVLLWEVVGLFAVVYRLDSEFRWHAEPENINRPAPMGEYVRTRCVSEFALLRLVLVCVCPWRGISGKLVPQNVSSKSLVRSAKKEAREAERKEEDKPLAKVCQMRVLPLVPLRFIFSLLWSISGSELRIWRRPRVLVFALRGRQL